MKNKVIVIGLGYQGEMFIKFFIKRNYEIIGVCKSETTKQKIRNKYGISVFLDYTEAVKSNVDATLIVLCAFPIDFYGEFFNFIDNYNIKVLTDLPITFDLELLKRIVLNNKIYFLLLETKLYFFNNVSPTKTSQVDAYLYFNKENLASYKNPREFILVDLQYMCMNLLNYDIHKIFIHFIEKKSLIKNIEYRIVVNDNIFYKYEDGRYYYIDKIMRQRISDVIVYDKLLEAIITDVENGRNLYKKEYFEKFSYLYKKYYV